MLILSLIFSTTSTNKGFFVLFETTNYNNDDYYFDDDSETGQLKSPVIDGNIKQCLNFWYHMYGKKYHLY